MPERQERDKEEGLSGTIALGKSYAPLTGSAADSPIKSSWQLTCSPDHEEKKKKK
jgi:hypothetical protein